MHRFWERWRPFFRELPHGATYLGSAMILAIWLAAGFHLYTFRHQLYELFRQNAANLARAFEQDVRHALHEVDWTIKLLRSQYVRNDPSFDFAGLISELTNADGLTFQYVIIGPDGLMLMSSVTSSAAAVNLSDREHFRVHLDSDQDRLFVSKPILGKVTGKWAIQLTRRITNADGSFGGVIVASVDPGHFSRLYDAIDVGRNGLIALAGTDGVIRSIKGAAAQSAAQSIAPSRFFEAIQGDTGSYEEAGPLDDVARVGSYLRVAGFPLIVSVGFAKEEILAGYRRELRIVLIVALGLSLLILAAMIIATRNRMKFSATTHALRSAEELAFARTLELKASDEREAMLRRDAALRQEAQSFNEKLVKSVKTFGGMIDGLANASELLSSLASQTRTHSGKVAEFHQPNRRKRGRRGVGGRSTRIGRQQDRGKNPGILLHIPRGREEHGSNQQSGRSSRRHRAPDRQRGRLDPENRAPDQSAGAQRGNRIGSRRPGRPGICGRSFGSQDIGQSDRTGNRGHSTQDQRHSGRGDRLDRGPQ